MKVKLAEYDKNILKVFSGTATAQAISFLLVPLIAKQYGPEHYGVYSAFLASITILSILSTCKYEYAIMLPNQRYEVVDLVKLCNWLNLLICLVILLCVSFVPLGYLNILFGIRQKSRLIFLLIPIGTYLLASFQICNYWLVREKMFTVLSLNKILRSILFGGFALTLGIFWPQALFLIIAVTCSNFLSNLFLRLKIRNLNLTPSFVLSREQLSVGKKYIEFPKFVLPAELINVVCAQLPIFVFLWLFNAKESGYFSFILTLLNIPISLLAGAVLDVFKEQASNDYRSLKSCRAVYMSTLKKMVGIAVVPFILLALFGHQAIILLFGAKWAAAGKFLNILLCMFFFKFISSPLSFVFYIVDKQREDFLWHIFLLITTLSVLYTGAIVYKDVLLTVQLYSLNFSIVYIIYLIRSFQLAKHKQV